MTTKPESEFKCSTNIEIVDWAFEKPQEQFESDLNIELAIVQKEMREYIMAEYNKRKAVKMEP